MTTDLDPEVFRRAAEYLSKPKSDLPHAACGCMAICEARSVLRGEGLLKVGPDHVHYFEDVLEPPFSYRMQVGAYWYGDVTPENQLARQLGLLLCALLVEEGFEP